MLSRTYQYFMPFVFRWPSNERMENNKISNERMENNKIYVRHSL